MIEMSMAVNRQFLCTRNSSKYGCFAINLLRAAVRGTPWSRVRESSSHSTSCNVGKGSSAEGKTIPPVGVGGTSASREGEDGRSHPPQIFDRRRVTSCRSSMSTSDGEVGGN